MAMDVALAKNFIGAHSIEELCASLERPRKVMMLVKAGQAVDDFIELVMPYLEPGDIIIDGGNSHFPDTIRRTKYVESKGFLVHWHRSIGGRRRRIIRTFYDAWWFSCCMACCKRDFSGSRLQKLKMDHPAVNGLAKVGPVTFVKMVHNGIEYGDMQIIYRSLSINEGVVGVDRLTKCMKSSKNTMKKNLILTLLK